MEETVVPLAPCEGEFKSYMCCTCGVQYEPASEPPDLCRICADDRQFIDKGGQKWTTQAAMIRSGHRNSFQLLEPNLFGIGTLPRFGIGQRALLVTTPEGNLLWDCISLLDPATIQIIKALGGIRAIAISHPHYYANCVEWSTTFGNAPIYIHSWDEEWLCRRHDNIKLWEGEKVELWGGLNLIHVGGHFAGSQILHWEGGASGKGSLLTGDILQVGADSKTVSVMRSFPNFIPLSPNQVKRIKKKLEGWIYDRVHGAFWDYTIQTEGSAKVMMSLDRYLYWLTADDVRA